MFEGRATAQEVFVPILTWNYKSQDDSIRHMGPMAQDFRAAFGLGADDKHISTVDADGVALSAVQELYRMVLQKDAQLQELQTQLRMLQVELAVVKATLPRDGGQLPALATLRTKLATLARHKMLGRPRRQPRGSQGIAHLCNTVL